MTKPLKADGWIIVNPYDMVWHSGIFETQKQAEAHLDKYWGAVDWRNMEFTIVRGVAEFSAEPPNDIPLYPGVTPDETRL